MLSFDAETGQLVAESGVLLADVIHTFLPRGWFPFVTPGTKFVTLGGMLAADVHGKNHHRDGGIANFVDWIDLVGDDGQIRRCCSTENAELFAWTIGGMGLTGVILRAAIRLRRVETGWIRQRLVPAADLAEVMRIFEENDAVTYSVAWIDCYASGNQQGRSIVMLGEHATSSELNGRQARDRFATAPRRKIIVPLDFPRGLLNRVTVGLFNRAYYAVQARKTGTQWLDWDSFFYPLDAVLEWPRIYGRAGFFQFQCVLPLETAHRGLAELLDTISAAGVGSFLAVLKRLGRQGPGLSFPLPGYTLALDFPVSPATLALAQPLDAITLTHGGRFYLAKDSRMTAQTMAQADDRSAAFRAFRTDAGLAEHFQSLQSNRLQL
jgi:FAD/FMN-containing dehydrogenase